MNKLLLLLTLALLTIGCGPSTTTTEEAREEEAPAVEPSTTTTDNPMPSTEDFGQLTDKRDGKTYKTVKIGNQVWMVENLHTFQFRNGDLIPIIKSDDDWGKAGENKQPACCYNENKGENGERYGVLYNWFAVNDSRGLAPEGWHVPSDDQWAILTVYLGYGAGTKMKSTSGWSSYSGKKECPQCPNWSPSIKAGTKCDRCNDKGEIKSELSGNGTNESGFTALPGGDRGTSGSFGLIGDTGHWWSATQGSAAVAWRRLLYLNYAQVDRDNPNKNCGFSVRCVRD